MRQKVVGNQYVCRLGFVSPQAAIPKATVAGGSTEFKMESTNSPLDTWDAEGTP